MSKSTLLRAGDISRSSELPRDTRVVLDFGHESYSAEQVRAFRDEGFQVVGLLATVPTLAPNPVLASFVEQGEPTLVRVDQSPSIALALEAFQPLTRVHLTFELPLRDEHDVNVLKILSSLGVKTRLSFDTIAAVTDGVRDAMYDAVLRPGRRATISPFSEMQQQYRQDGFEIAQLDYRENDHFVDLRSSSSPRPRSAWDDVRVDQKRVPFLLDLKECAFCEGLLFCHGYLARDGASLERCRAMLSEFVEVHNLAYASVNGASSVARTRAQTPARSDSNERNRW